MAEFREISPFCNFTLLTKNLHALFMQYIVGGRKRAPPETELMDMISTFQLGARTDRRALQSKFKSWAKRMAVENDMLKLACSNKEIIPLEKCGELVMRLHSNGHKSVDRVISQIQETCTWSKKNFGMDRSMVLNFIAMNCSNPGCRRKIENEISKRECCENFIKSVIVASETRPGMFQNQLQQGFPLLMTDQTFINSSSMYAWPMIFPLPPNAFSEAYCFPYNTQGGDVGQVQSFISNSSDNQSNLSCVLPRNPKNRNPYLRSPSKLHKNKLSSTPKRKKVFGSSGTFRKPKNICEFKTLVSAAEQLSDSYPSILKDKKTKFLGFLDWVPKKLCSKRTLLKLEREKRRKRTLEKQHMLYHKNRKNLRDRNKLNKIKLKQQREKRAYLDLSGSAKKLLSQSDKSVGEEPRAGGEIERSFFNTEDSEIEIVKVISPRNEPEVIQITSSEDEGKSENSFTVKKTERKDVKELNYSKDVKLEPIGCSVSSGAKHSDAFTRQFLHKKAPGNESCVEIVFKAEGQDGSNVNPFHMRNNFRQNPILNQPLIPANLKGEIAVLPNSMCPPVRPLGHKNHSNTQELKMKILPGSHFVAGKSSSSILQPISNVMPCKQGSQIFVNSYPTGQLPTDTNIFLVEKTPDGGVRMVPCGPTNNMDSQMSLKVNKNPSIPRIIAPTTDTKKQPTKILPTQKKNIAAKPLQTSTSKKRSIKEEMSRLSKWIRKTKLTMVHTFFNHHVDRSTQRLEAQLTTGIALVKCIRRKLCEIEKSEQTEI